MHEPAFALTTTAAAARPTTTSTTLDLLKRRNAFNGRGQGGTVHGCSLHGRHAEQAEYEGHQGSEDDSLHFMHPAKLYTQKGRRNLCERQAT
jgi:hypothetical protein